MSSMRCGISPQYRALSLLAPSATATAICSLDTALPTYFVLSFILPAPLSFVALHRSALHTQCNPRLTTAGPASFIMTSGVLLSPVLLLLLALPRALHVLAQPLPVLLLVLLDMLQSLPHVRADRVEYGGVVGPGNELLSHQHVS